MTAPAIEVRDLCKQYGSVWAVDHVSFAVPPGELVGFLGQNGAGKTTTMRVLTTFMPASSGTARVAGFDVMYQSLDVRKNLGYLQESVPLYPEMRVEEYLRYRAKLKQVDRSVRAARIGYCLERCRVKNVRDRLLGTLSKGYRQRVGLADALLADPPVLILDEPLTGLDPVQQEETLASIRELGGKHTVLFSSHHLTDVEKVCDRVIIIDRGKVHFDDRLSNIRGTAAAAVLDVRGPEADILALLQKLPGVAEVRNVGPADGGATTFEVKPHDGKDLREPLAAAVVAKGYGLRRVGLRQTKLEEVFLKVAFQRGTP